MKSFDVQIKYQTSYSEDEKGPIVVVEYIIVHEGRYIYYGLTTAQSDDEVKDAILHDLTNQ